MATNNGTATNRRSALIAMVATATAIDAKMQPSTYDADDEKIAAKISDVTTKTRTALNDATGQWTQGRAVVKGERILAPTGAVVVATEAHTTGSVYDASLYEGTAPVVPFLEVYEAKAEALRKAVYQADSETIYSVTSDTTAKVYKTTDGGQNWTQKGDVGFLVHTMTRIMGTGTLVAVQETPRHLADQNPKVARSVDDGMTWTEVTTLVHPGLVSQSALSPADGVVLLAEYGNTIQTKFRIRRSSDDGLTWSTVLESTGTDPLHDPGHIHSVVMDPANGWLVAFLDRPLPEVYTSKDKGATWTLLGISTRSYHPNWVAPMFFANHIAWGNDNHADGRVFRLTRNDFYAGRWDNPETVAMLANDRFYDTFPIGPDMWLMVGAVEIVDPTKPSTYNPEVYIVSGEGALVSGGLSVSLPLPNLTGAHTGSRVMLAGYPAYYPDMHGHTWINLPTQGMPRPYSMVAATVGRNPNMPRVQNAFASSPILPAGSALYWRQPDGIMRSVLSVGIDGVTNLTAGINAVRVTHTADAVMFLVNGQIVGSFRGEGQVMRKKPIHLNTAADGPSLRTGNNSPEGVVTARLGSLYLEYGARSALWQRLNSDSVEGNTGWVIVPSAPEALKQDHFSSVTSVINSKNKYAGKMAWNSTTKRPLWASGPAPSDPWVDGQGAVVHQPT